MVRPWYWPKNGMPERTEPFTWIIRSKMAISWWPDPYVIKIYQTEGIKAIINCSEFNNRKDIPKEFKYYHINIPDFGIPDETQILEFFKITNEFNSNKLSVVIHCVAGCGRSGIMGIAWAAYNNYIPEEMDPVVWIRKLRPCCLETKEQMDLARKIARKYRKRT